MSLGKSHLIIFSNFNPLNMDTRSTDTCFFPNQQTTIMKKSTSLSRTLHYELSTVIDLSFVEVEKTFSWLHVDVLSATVDLIRGFVDVNFRLFWHHTSSADNEWSWLSYVIYRWVIFEPFVGLVRGMTALWRLDMFTSTISNVKVMFYFFTYCSSTGSGIFVRLRARRGRGIVKKKPC